MSDPDRSTPYDLLIVGGGINGAAIARDAAGRGLSVLLVERGDLAGATSSKSSKLIHGGLRYLESYEFRLVRESLAEREVLLRAAPHIIWPLRFVLPLHKGLRPGWLIRAGLVLYDHLGGRQLLPSTRRVRRGKDAIFEALKPQYRSGFEYSDCWADDARLVVLNALDAAERGADIRVRTRFVSAERGEEHWRAQLQSEGSDPVTVEARALVNAAGPWVGEVLGQVGGIEPGHTPRLVKGSHIVVRRLHDLPDCFTFQSADGRVVFSIPYEEAFTLIGTTDVPVEGEPEGLTASPEEIEYLCGAASEYFAQAITPADVVWTYCGVRPLYDDGKSNASAVTRDYVFDLDAGDGRPPLLSIYGGKLTTHRRLAEHALRDLQPHLGLEGEPWTETARFPGGDIDIEHFDDFVAEQARRYPAVDPHMIRRLCRAYGTRLDLVLGDGSGLGQPIGGRIFEAELAYLRDYEWARRGEDVLWRRSKLGLHLNADDQARVEAFFSG